MIVTHQRVQKCENDIIELKEVIKKLTETIKDLQSQIEKSKTKKDKKNESV